MGIETIGGQLAFAEKGVGLYFSSFITAYTRNNAVCIGNLLRCAAICTGTPKQEILSGKTLLLAIFFCSGYPTASLQLD